MYKLTLKDGELKCDICEKKSDKFTDMASLREYTLTSTCQKCQDNVIFDSGGRVRRGANVDIRRLKGERFG